MGKQPAGNQLPTELQGFAGAIKQNIFKTGLQALCGCVDLPLFCTSSPFKANSTATPQGSPRPLQFQQHHQDKHSHEINTHKNLITQQISLRIQCLSLQAIKVCCTELTSFISTMMCRTGLLEPQKSSGRWQNSHC